MVREVRVPPELRDQLGRWEDVEGDDLWDDEGPSDVEMRADNWRLNPNRPSERPAADPARCDPRRER